MGLGRSGRSVSSSSSPSTSGMTVGGGRGRGNGGPLVGEGTLTEGITEG